MATSFLLRRWLVQRATEEAEAEAERIAKLPRVAAPQGWYAALDNKSGEPSSSSGVHSAGGAAGAPFFHNTLTKERCWTDPRTRKVRTAACVHNLD